MKAILTSLMVVVLTMGTNAQNMKTPIDIITQMFVATDEHNWQEVEDSFAPSVRLDYSSMNGNPATELSPTAITDSWKTILPGFTHTHHQLGNFQSSIDENKAHVSCYGTATHYLEDEEGSLWTVVGTYDFELEESADGTWRITAMTFNYKYMEGNSSLPEKAMNNLK